MSNRISIPHTDLSLFPLCLGGNVFGWSADEEQSQKVLDAYEDAGGNFIDTADVYSEWVPGNTGGESESIIGRWMSKRKNRSEMVIATKVAKYSKRPGLSKNNILAAVDDSLRRLQTDHIDIYYAHEDDQTTPLEETLGAFDAIVKSGKVRYIAASNYSPARLREALAISTANHFASYIAVQNQYNLMERNDFESGMSSLLAEESIASFPYYGLARGFLSGKYRKGVTVESVRAKGVEPFLTDKGYSIVEALIHLADAHKSNPSAVALAWLRAQGSATIPIASARTVEQVQELTRITPLSGEEVAGLSRLSAL
jgi:aryl-alcohol dehydrogenase-like predicted oxidoreductase